MALAGFRREAVARAFYVTVDEILAKVLCIHRESGCRLQGLRQPSELVGASVGDIAAGEVLLDEVSKCHGGVTSRRG